MSTTELIHIAGICIAATSAIIGANAYIVRLVVQNAVKDAMIQTGKDIDAALAEHEKTCPALTFFLNKMAEME